MELELTADQRNFREATQSFLGDRYPTAEVRALRHDPDGFDRGYWRQGAELGWTSLLASEKDGGGTISGRSVCDLTLIAFEFGRFAAPGPLTATNMVVAALGRSGTDEQKIQYLPSLLDGSQIASWAWAEPVPHDRLGEVALEATRNGSGYVLNGRKSPVEAAGQSDLLLVTAKDGDGLTQILVPTAAAGVTITPMKTIDLTRRFGTVTFDNVEVPASAVVGSPGEAADDVERQLQLAVVIQLAETVGAMDRGMEISYEWMFNRFSFGRPLASYQVLKHRYVDMRGWLESGNAIADSAANQVEDESERAGEYISAGKSFLGVYGPEVLQECVQLHGGIGATFEHDLHLFLRRVVLNAQLYGTVADHRERLTAILEQQELINA